MCRLFGSRSHVPGGVAHELLRGSNALREQSREHPDGWGLAWYLGDEPQVARSLSPAHADDEFERVSDFVEAQTVVAHIRKASVGRIALSNTHPFQHGRWIFAHNGTVPLWKECAGPLTALIDPGLRKSLAGETDSERCFLLFLTHLSRRCDPEEADFFSAAQALTETVRDVLCVTTAPLRKARGDAAPPSTTFLATDGKLMLACRRGRTLHVSAPPRDARGCVPWFAVSSEDPTGKKAVAGGARAPWRDLPEDALVGVDKDLHLYQGTLDLSSEPV
jgi:glutamine amidotransferase